MLTCSPPLEINDKGLAFYNLEGPDGQAGKFAVISSFRILCYLMLIQIRIASFF